eukprot:4388361-Pyramimonas_sp.AAC.1
MSKPYLEKWARRCFGEHISSAILQRPHRFRLEVLRGHRVGLGKKGVQSWRNSMRCYAMQRNATYYAMLYYAMLRGLHLPPLLLLPCQRRAGGGG